jgi:hypothetical protein
MSVEDDLEEYARRVNASRSKEKTTTDPQMIERAQNMRAVLLMDAEGLIARSPQALKAKAKMIWDDDSIQNPTSREASFVRSLLRDLLQWEP